MSNSELSLHKALATRGWLLKQVVGGSEEYKKRFFLLEEDGFNLIFFEKESDVADKTKMKGRILLADVKQIINGDDLKFDLATGNKIISLKALSKPQKTEWILALSFLLQLLQNANEKKTSQEHSRLSEQLVVENQQLQLDKERLEENITALIEARQAAKKRLEELTEEVTRVSNENAVLKNDFEALQKEYNSEKERNQKLLSASKPLEEIQELEKNRIVELERALDVERDKANDAKTELQKASGELEAEQLKNELLKKELAKFNPEGYEPDTKNIELEASVNQLKRELADKAELIKQRDLKVYEAGANRAELEREIDAERERNASLQKNLASQKEKVDFLEQKLATEGQSVSFSEQETKMLELNTKIAQLEAELNIQKENVERLSSFSNELKIQLASSEENLSKKIESHMEEKSDLNNQISQLQLRIEKLQYRFQLETGRKDPSEISLQKNDSLASFAQIFNALLKNLYLGYEDYPKTEEQLLEELESLLSSIAELRSFGDLYIFMKERQAELKRRHEAELIQKETILKTLQERNDELEENYNSFSNQKKDLLENLSKEQLEKQEVVRKLLEKVEEFSVFYESMVKSLFTTVENNSGRRNSTSFLFRLEAAALENQQLLPLLSSYKFLDSQIKKELLELRTLKVTAASAEPENKVVEKTDNKSSSKNVAQNLTNTKPSNDKLLEETLREFTQYFLDLIEMKGKGPDRKERAQKLEEALSKVDSLKGLLEAFSRIQKKIEDLLKPVEDRDRKYENQLATARKSIKKLTDEVIFLGEKLLQSRVMYTKIQETLKESTESISNFEHWMSRVEEACIMLGGIIHDLYDSGYNQHSLVFELKPKDKENRLSILVKEIPELHELSKIMTFLKDALRGQGPSPRFRNDSPTSRSRKELSSIERKMISRESTAIQLNHQPVPNISGRAVTEASYIRNLSFENGYAFTNKRLDPDSGANTARSELRLASSIEKIPHERREFSGKRVDNGTKSLNVSSISPQKMNERDRFQNTKPYTQESLGKVKTNNSTNARAVTPNSSQISKIFVFSGIYNFLKKDSRVSLNELKGRNKFSFYSDQKRR